MTIKILGSGCPNCDKLEALAKKAAAELNVSAAIEHVRDLNQIVDYGVMRTPGLVINEEVKASGRIPSIDEIKNWIQKSVSEN